MVYDLNPAKTYQANAYLTDSKCQETRRKRSPSGPNNDIKAAKVRGTQPQNGGNTRQGLLTKGPKKRGGHRDQ